MIRVATLPPRPVLEAGFRVNRIASMLAIATALLLSFAARAEPIELKLAFFA